MNIRNTKIILILFFCTQLILSSEQQSSINRKNSVLWGMILSIGGIGVYYGIKRLWNSGCGQGVVPAWKQFIERFEYSDDEAPVVIVAPPPAEPKRVSSLGSNSSANSGASYVCPVFGQPSKWVGGRIQTIG